MDDLHAPSLHPWLKNYLQFLAFFRGHVSAAQDGEIVVVSDRPDFSMLFPLSPAAREHLAAFAGSIMALPSATWLPDALVGVGCHQVAELVFMEKALASAAGPLPSPLRLATTDADLEAFSLAQARGFIEDPVEFKDWFPWLRDANLRNLKNPHCDFIIAEVDAGAGAVSLLVESANACGLYAVATPPEYRRRGLATRLLDGAERLARGRGHAALCLQVYADTYAHGFYARHGFVESYRLGIWWRERA